MNLKTPLISLDIETTGVVKNNTPPPQSVGGQAAFLRSLPRLLEGTFLFLLIFALATPAFAAVAPAVQTYDQLLTAIREVRSESEEVIEQEKIRVAWETGKLIDQHILQHKDRADYGQRVLKRLAADLETSDTELYRMLKFFRQYPISAPAQKLPWSYYREILSLDETEERKEVTDEAASQHWNRSQVRAEVRRRQAGSAAKKEKYPSAKPGKINIYRIVKSTAGPNRGQLAVDLGFSNYFLPVGTNELKEGDVVLLENEKLKKIPASEEDLFTYTAYVTEVIDGDTFHALVELGFHFVTEQKLRLRGLDAPEIESSDGREAKEFLEKQGIRPGAKILIKTLKSDKYDRYLADVWTLRSDPASSGSARTTGDERWVDGKYINQQLFDEGLAVMVSE